jgi:hypothetical protein
MNIANSWHTARTMTKPQHNASLCIRENVANEEKKSVEDLWIIFGESNQRM